MHGAQIIGILITQVRSSFTVAMWVAEECPTLNVRQEAQTLITTTQATIGQRALALLQLRVRM